MTLTLDAATALLDTLIALPDAEGTKSIILQQAEAGGLPADGFRPGDPSERWPEVMARSMVDWGYVPEAAVRALFFPFGTDPGDVDDFGRPDPSRDQTPRPGMLSAAGVSWWGTTRGGQTFATALVTIRNDSGAAIVLTAGALTFEASGESRTDQGTPTYITTADGSIYTGIGGTLTLANGATSPPLPVLAQQPGAYGSTVAAFGGAGVGIDVCVTQSFGTLTVTAATKATGTEREDRLAYIERCQLEGDGLAPSGPSRAYLRAMNTARDGTPLQRHDGTGPVTITSDSYVSTDSSTGEVTIYYRGPDGPVDAVDVDTANANIIGLVVGSLTDPSGVLPDCVGLLPKTYSSEALPDGTAGGESCTATPIDVTYNVKIRARDVPGGATPGTYTNGGSPPTSIANVFAAILASLTTYFPSTGIGGLDQSGGSGVVYTADIPGIIRSAKSGLYDPTLTLPSTSTTAIAVGHIATVGTVLGTLVVVA